MQKRKRKPLRLCSNSWAIELMASPTQPMPKAERTRHLTEMWLALANMESAQPSQSAWSLCADAVNMLESIVRHGYAQDTSGLLDSSAQALANTVRSSKANKTAMRLSEQDTQDLRAVLSSYADCINTLPHRTVLRMRTATEQHIRAAQAGQTTGADVIFVEA